MKTLGDFVDSIKQNALESGGAKLGAPWYNPYGDCVEVLLEDCAYSARRVDDYLTVYTPLDSDRIIGLQIKGVVGLLKSLEADGIFFAAEVDGDGIHTLSLDTLLFHTYHGEGKITPDRFREYMKVGGAVHAENKLVTIKPEEQPA